MIKDKLSFNEMLKELENGGYAYLSNGCILFKQIPAIIEKDKISNMQSVPLLVKNKMINHINDGIAEHLSYENQYIRMDMQLRMTYYCFSGDDINSNDWTVVVKD